MAPTLPPTLSPAELAYLHTSLSLTPPIRPDARSPTTFRPLVAETSLLPACNGSARLCFADGTEALVGVKAEVEKTPLNGASKSGEDLGEDVGMGGTEGEEAGSVGTYEGGVGDEKWVEVTVDIPGQRDDDPLVVFLGAMIHEALVGDGMLVGRLRLGERWHWKLFVDVCSPLAFFSSLLPSRYGFAWHAWLIYRTDSPHLPSPAFSILPSPSSLPDDPSRPPLNFPPRTDKFRGRRSPLQR